jgi:hypothetical protein
MLGKLAVVLSISIGCLGFAAGSASATAVVPPKAGSISCAVNGSVTVGYPTLQPTIANVVVFGKISNCTYNGIKVPFVGGGTYTIAHVDRTKVCSVLTNGGSFGKDITKVTAFGTTVTLATIKVTLSPAVPSGSGSAINLDGSLTTLSLTVSVHASIVSDQPVGALCGGATNTLNYSGNLSLSWT